MRLGSVFVSGLVKATVRMNPDLFFMQQIGLFTCDF